jgi:hypothetical protein
MTPPAPQHGAVAEQVLRRPPIAMPRQSRLAIVLAVTTALMLFAVPSSSHRREKRLMALPVLLLVAAGGFGCGRSTTMRGVRVEALPTTPRTATVKPLHALGDKAAAPIEASSHP